MPMKLEICVLDPASIPRVEVTIPDKCPGCGQDFHEPGAIREIQYTQGMQYFHIDKDGIPGWEGCKSIEGDLPVYHECAECQLQITEPPSKHLVVPGDGPILSDALRGPYDRNPRYVLFAKAHGHGPEAQMKHDEQAWPGGRMIGFICWMSAAWSIWRVERGFKNQREAGLAMGERMFSDFDAWLATHLDQIPKEEKSRQP